MLSVAVVVGVVVSGWLVLSVPVSLVVGCFLRRCSTASLAAAPPAGESTVGTRIAA